MTEGPKIIGNPLHFFVYLLILSYLLGEFIFPKYPLLYLINMIGIIGLLLSLFLFFSAFGLFKSYDENPLPTSKTKKLIKTGIFAYTRNPIYLAFVIFHISMFMVFENVVYFLSAIGLAIWIHNYVIKKEEKYLFINFSEEYERYSKAVSRWIFF